MMVYDGRYRLGCEGILYILLEIFDPSEVFFARFWNTIQERSSFTIASYFDKNQGDSSDYFTYFQFDGDIVPVNQNTKASPRSLPQF